jgi:hypothetical protein
MHDSLAMAFDGARGMIIECERDGSMVLHRVHFESPVQVVGTTPVESDLFSSSYLRRIK